ncbi:MAG: radical SAM protein [Candidatus Eisenbacteria bacterium]|nr:radical SAM protein [Candidatus Eisenbacteria bacterium]
MVGSRDRTGRGEQAENPGRTVAKVRITEIFYSIQGESTYAGRPCLFVRLTGCPLRCVWCDTAYAFQGGTSWTVEEVLAEVRKRPVRLVEITGGEPLAQPAAFDLIRALSGDGYEVLVETGGAVSIEGIDPRAVLIYDVKCPDSGEVERNRWENLPLLRPGRDEVKFVLASRRDYVWALQVLRERRLHERHTVLFSPVTRSCPPSDLAAWILEDAAPVRLQLQLHKLIWGADARGV